MPPFKSTFPEVLPIVFAVDGPYEQLGIVTARILVTHVTLATTRCRLMRWYTGVEMGMLQLCGLSVFTADLAIRMDRH